jgi:hypothetical protein
LKSPPKKSNFLWISDAILSFAVAKNSCRRPSSIAAEIVRDGLDQGHQLALIAAALRQFVRDNDLGACVDGGLCIIGLNEPSFDFMMRLSGSVKLRCDLGSGWSDAGAAGLPACVDGGLCIIGLNEAIQLVLLVASSRRRDRRGNGRRRDIGNRSLKGVKLLGHSRHLLGQLLRLGLLSGQLILNDLQLVDGLLLRHLETFRRLEKLVRSLAAVRWCFDNTRGRSAHLASAQGPRRHAADQNEGGHHWNDQPAATTRVGAVLFSSLARKRCIDHSGGLLGHRAVVDLPT